MSLQESPYSLPTCPLLTHIQDQGDRTMQVKTIGWFVGSLGLLLGAGTALADDKTETTGQDVVNQMSGKLECGDTGVTVAFKTGSSELDQNAMGALDGLSNWMKANPERTLRLQGYAS